MSSNTLKKRYHQEVIPQLMKEFSFKNALAVPRVKKVVVNLGLGEAAANKGLLEKVIPNLSIITGQKPKIAKARISEAGFRLRKGDPIGLVVTLRGQRMYDFLEKLFRVVLPRLRDFQGLSAQSFDGQGNYNLGIDDSTVFPETVHLENEETRGLQITLVTNTNDDQKAKRLLELMGMPFAKKES